ncbi:polysaccharide biosynthesis C-terminal domain-containing protein, partial [Mesorhizobium sp.]
HQHLLTMTGHERAGAAIFFASAVGNFAACVMMINLFGIVGAALAMTAATVAFNIATAVTVARYLKLAPGLVIAITNMSKSPPNHS